MNEEQLDRIEAKLDDLLAFRDVLLKLALPKLPGPLRASAVKLLAPRGVR